MISRPAGLFLWLCLAWPAAAQYSGPALLSRGEAPAAMSNTSIRFQPFVEVTADYSTGLRNIGLDSTGNLINSNAVGTSLIFGVSGTHAWRHDSLGMSYRGMLTHLVGESGYDSLDQSMMLGYKHQLSRHMTASLRESAGMLTRNFGLTSLPSTVPFDPSTTFVPTTDYFDNRTIYLDSAASLALQKTSRLSFSFGGESIRTIRRSKALHSETGYVARGDMQYRMTRRTTVGLGYTYLRFQYSGAVGQTDAHGALASYSIRISRAVEFSAYGGPMFVESKFIETVAPDPVIQVLLGIGASQQVAYNKRTLLNAAGRISRTFRTGVVYAGGGRSVTPGNGLFMTSYTTQALAGYSYTGLRRWSAAASLSYARADAAGTIQGIYSGYSAFASMSRSLRYYTHFVASVAARKYDSPDFSRYNRLIYEARVGIGFAPGEVPLRIW